MSEIKKDCDTCWYRDYLPGHPPCSRCLGEHDVTGEFPNWSGAVFGDYISREDALNFEMEIEAEPEEIQAISRGMALMSEHIKGLPAADLTERKAGEWKYDPEYGWCVCSSCDGYVVLKSMKDHYHFCPNCGADMRGDNDV